ncbi:hypothetical protein [Halopelagius longus]|uniref:DUF2268 domain-containing protein n=1 Tax=Halopelagius longus TaxID=1236180 RepID=A0A1H0XYY3_9EURY|nr:hypothetical protein [Halopelagius longus]RDI72182.1 hypothetical protein DWB78_10920 [Halopelagius longus]SDQ08108.1 hypothetical protein SAMN05216278_0292 [Halopelagius longus]
MQIDWSAAERFLSYVDGEESVSRLWNHPAYDVVREHAAVLGRDVTPEGISEAVDGEPDAFPGLEGFSETRPRIVRLLDRVRSREREWTDEIERHLRRVVPNAETSDVTVYLGVGYEIGVGVRSGAYVNLNEPLFLRAPRQLLYTCVHESSHVLYEGEHDALDRLGPRPMEYDDQRAVWNTVFHTEAFATYAPLELRRSDGNVGGCDHVICDDYAVLSDSERLRTLVEEYDSVRERISRESLSPDEMVSRLFGGSRLPYRVGCALLEAVERRDGPDAVRDAFSTDPVEFPTRYDWALDEYRA